MKRIILILIFLLFGLVTNEQPVEQPIDYWEVGRFIVIKTQDGYQARTDSLASCCHKTMFNAIKEISISSL